MLLSLTVVPTPPAYRGPTCLRAMGLRCSAPPTCSAFACPRRDPAAVAGLAHEEMRPAA